MEKLFLTGASGCIGHYIVDELVGKYELYLLVRSPEKLMFDPEELPNTHLLCYDLEEIGSLEELLAQMDYCVHVATAWGGEAATRINIKRTLELFSLLSPKKVKRVIYFSTASILGKGNLPLPEAGTYGTDYVRTKYECYQQLSQSSVYDRIITVFPTLVFGGDEQHPASHLTSGLPAARRYSWLMRHLNLDAWFHFIHAQDIAKIVGQLLTIEAPEANYVLGNEALSFREFITRTVQFFGRRPSWSVTLSPKFLLGLGSLFGAQISSWDRFCLGYKDFRYDAVNAKTFNLASRYNTVEGVLADWQLVQK